MNELIESLVEKIKKLEFGSRCSICELLGDEELKKHQSNELLEIYKRVKEACDEADIIFNTEQFNGEIVGLAYAIPFVKEKKVIDLKRSAIKKFIDDKYKNTQFNKNIEGVKNQFTIMGEMTLNDLDFINVLKELLLNIKVGYEDLNSINWEPSKRQSYLIDNLGNLINDMSNKSYDSNRYFVQDHYDFFWEVWDYFDDYNNQNEEISKEEMKRIVEILERFFEYMSANKKDQ